MPLEQTEAPPLAAQAAALEWLERPQAASPQ